MGKRINQSLFLAGLCGCLVLSSAVSLSAAWVNAVGTLSGLPTECGNLQSIWAVPNVNLTITGVANNGLYGTSNGGVTWTKITDSVKVRLMQMIFDPDNPNTWYAGGIYHTPGIWKTTNAGATWVGFNGIATNDGFAVDFSDTQRKTLLAGGHESQGNLYRSTNSGTTWTNIGCPTGGYSSFPYIINTQTYLMGIQSVGIYRSTDADANWTKVSTTAPISHIMKTAAGDLYYTGGGKMVKGSADGSTWTVMSSSTVAGAAPVELPGGKIGVINSNGIAISADKGATWISSRCRPLPSAITGFYNFNGAIGLAYNSVGGAFYTFYWDCVFNRTDTIVSDQIWRFDTMITSGSEVMMPRNTAFTNMSFEMGKDISVFDVSGRVVSAAIPGPSRKSNHLFLVRKANGRIYKLISNDK